jgi:hypothetical protein
MHEVLLSRGDVQGSADEVKAAIHVAENCVLVHPGCHQHADEIGPKALCARNLLLFEGYSHIAKWLTAMDFMMKSDQPREQLLYLDALLEQLATYKIEGFEPKRVWRF